MNTSHIFSHAASHCDQQDERQSGDRLQGGDGENHQRSGKHHHRRTGSSGQDGPIQREQGQLCTGESNTNQQTRCKHTTPHRHIYSVTLKSSEELFQVT